MWLEACVADGSWANVVLVVVRSKDGYSSRLWQTMAPDTETNFCWELREAREGSRGGERECDFGRGEVVLMASMKVS